MPFENGLFEHIEPSIVFFPKGDSEQLIHIAGSWTVLPWKFQTMGLEHGFLQEVDPTRQTAKVLASGFKALQLEPRPLIWQGSPWAGSGFRPWRSWFFGGSAALEESVEKLQEIRVNEKSLFKK